MTDNATPTGKTAKLIDAIAAGFAPVLREYINAQIDKATAPLLQRIGELETREPLPYQGVWEGERTYRHGMFATWKGGIWYARRDTRQRPGEGPDWLLSVKSGRDGRDAPRGNAP